MDLFVFDFGPQVALTLNRQEHHLQEVPNCPPPEGMTFDTGPMRGAWHPSPSVLKGEDSPSFRDSQPSWRRHRFCLPSASCGMEDTESLFRGRERS